MTTSDWWSRCWLKYIYQASKYLKVTNRSSSQKHSDQRSWTLMRSSSLAVPLSRLWNPGCEYECELEQHTKTSNFAYARYGWWLNLLPRFVVVKTRKSTRPCRSVITLHCEYDVQSSPTRSWGRDHRGTSFKIQQALTVILPLRSVKLRKPPSRFLLKASSAEQSKFHTFTVRSNLIGTDSADLFLPI